MRLAIITTHPVQYYAPLFELLTSRRNVDIMVFYTWGEKALDKYDPGFRMDISWDIPLMSGYPHCWLKNTASDPGSSHFMGIINPDLPQTIEKWAPDAIMLYGWAYHSHLRCLQHFHGRLPMFFRGDSTLLDQQKGIRQWARTLFLTWTYRKVTLAFYAGQHNKEYFTKHGLKTEQLIHLPHAVDNDRFAIPRAAEVRAIRQQYCIQEQHTLILFAGKLETKKNPALLLEVFMELQVEHSSAQLLIVGNGHLRESLIATAEGHPNIHFMDFQNQQYMPVIYQSADIFCLPSIGPGETWGLAVNEAMASGTAILVSDKVGSATDLVKDGRNGYIFQAASKEHLKTTLRQMLKQGREKINKMGKEGQQIIGDWSFLQQAITIEKEMKRHG